MNNEKYKINGIVKIYDEDKNLIYETHNMIVQEGRLAILNTVFSNTVKPSSNTFPILKYFYENSDETVLTTPEMTWQNIKNPTILDYSVDLTSPNTFKATQDNSGINIKYEAKITWNKSNMYAPITAVGLCWSDTSTHLFSRAAIDNVYMNPNKTYIIEHTVYF